VRSRVATIAALLVPMVLAAACTASRGTRHPNPRQDMERTIAFLSKRSDPDSLAAAGVLLLRTQADQGLLLLARATAAAPSRVDLAWLQIQVCLRIPSCASQPMEVHLRTLDPSNGAGWLGALNRAESAGDASAKGAALLHISHADRVAIYWTTLISRLTPAVARAGVLPLPQAEVAVIGMLAAADIPPYKIIADYCIRGQLADDQDVALCRGIGRALERGDTYATELIGIAIARHVWPENSAEWKAAAYARSVYEYRTNLLAHLEAHVALDRHAAEGYLALCAKYPREQDVARARLLEAGEKPDPPAQ